MRGLTIVVADRSPERLRCALSLAAAHAALGASTGLFCQGEAVAVLRRPLSDPDDPRHAAAGLPTLAALLEEAFALGVRVTLCQSGLQLAAATPADFDPRCAYGGAVGMLQDLGDGRLLAV